MAKNQDTLIRQWHMLRLIPRYPQKITVQALQSRLSGEGFEITSRSVQRDLLELSEVFPLTVDDREKPFGWSWQKDAKSFDLPGLTAPEAMTWVLAEQHLSSLFPVSVLDHLRPYFKAAHDRLNGEPLRARSWLDKVLNVSPSQPLLPPTIDEGIHRTITDALLHEKQVKISYRKRNQELKEYRVHPLAIVQRGSVIYLYCTLFDYTEPRIFVLHRISSAELLEVTAVAPEGFDLKASVEEGVWGFGKQDEVRFSGKFKKSAGNHLFDTPLSSDQEIEETPDGFLIVKATVTRNHQFIWWILGFGADIEVIEPDSLRQKIALTAVEMARIYQTN